MIHTPHVTCRSGQQGFVLVTTLWFLAILTIVAGGFAAWVNESLDQAWERRQATDALVDRRGTRDTVLFIAATRPMNAAGLALPSDGTGSSGVTISDDTGGDGVFGAQAPPTGNELSLAGLPYEGVGQARFTLQDEGGLLNPNGGRPERIDRFLGLLGVEGSERAPLVDNLRDYLDEGDSKRLHGATSDDYEEAGRAPPPNRYLLSGMEAWRVLGWREHEGIWRRARWREHVTVTEFSGLNLNTSPPLLLRTDPLIDEDDARRLVEERQEEAFLSPEDAAARTDVPVDANLFAFVTNPSRHFRLTLWHDGARQGMRYHVRLTPQSEEGSPWQIDHVYPVDRYGLNLDEPASVDNRVFSAAPVARAP